MATSVTDTGYSFLDLQKDIAPDGKGLLPIADVLNQINAPLQDGPITPANAKLGHRITVQLALPPVQTVKVNQGLARAKATTEQRQEAIGSFGTSNSVDNKMRSKWGALFDQFRAKQDRPFIEAMSQKVAQYFAYGDTGTIVDEAGFDGLAVRMGALQQPAPGTNGSQVWSKGTVVGGDGTSMYVVDWNADMGAHWIYPEESANGGLDVKNHDDVPLTDNDGNTYFGSVAEYFWDIGLAVEDPRRIARLANIDTSDANLGGLNTQGNIVNGLVDVLSYMPDPIGFNRVIYCHARIQAAWWKQLLDKGAPQYITQGEYLGKPSLFFAGCPIRRLDQLTLSESTVS